APAALPAQASIRAIVLNPSRYLDQKVAITGQFSGRNLLGEMPDAPGKSRYDFVLRSTDAAVWISNMRPRLKDANGKEFELGLARTHAPLGTGAQPPSPRSLLSMLCRS